jgi:hypothetical protein
VGRDEVSPKPTSRGALIIAAVVLLIIDSVVPFGGVILYPLTLLATWVHEMGHGLSALALGGGFASLDVFANASGLAHTSIAEGWRDGLVALGGLAAPAVAGASLLATSRGPRPARLLLAGMAVAIVLSLVVWVRSMAGWIGLTLDALVIGIFAVWGGPRERMVFAQLLGVSLAVDTWSRKDYLFTDAAMVDGQVRSSDIATVARSFGGWYLAWGLLVLGASLALLALGFRAAWRRG